jgi:hypothetical protein
VVVAAASEHDVVGCGSLGQGDSPLVGDLDLAAFDLAGELGLELGEDFTCASGGAHVNADALAELAFMPVFEGFGELAADLRDMGGDDEQCAGPGWGWGLAVGEVHGEGDAEDDGHECEDGDFGEHAWVSVSCSGYGVLDMPGV